MRDYIFPDEINFEDATISAIDFQKPDYYGNLDSSDNSYRFSPRHLDRSRLPYNVIFVEDLASRMKGDLLALLEERHSSTILDAPSEDLKDSYDLFQRRFSDVRQPSPSDEVWTQRQVNYFGGSFSGHSESYITNWCSAALLE